MNELTLPSGDQATVLSPLIAASDERAAGEFFDWLAAKGVTQLAAIESLHVATHIDPIRIELFAGSMVGFGFGAHSLTSKLQEI